MFRLFVALLSAVLLIQPAAAQSARPEVAKYIKAYEGAEGAQVWTLRIGPVKANEALVQITNVDNPLDKKILRCQVEQNEGARSYYTRVDGQRYLLLKLGNRGGGELYLPGESAMGVGYSEGLSQEGNAEHFLTDYLQQGGK